MYRYFYGKIVYPLYHGLIRSGALKAIAELESHDRLSAEQLHELERLKLRNLLVHASIHVPYYRDVVSGSGTDAATLADAERFLSLPVLTKSLIRDQGTRLQSEVLDGNKLDPNSTSGSTGSPMRFYTDRRSKSYRKAVDVRTRRWLGIEVGDPVAHIWGSPIDQARAEAMRGKLHAKITRELFLSANGISEDDFANYAEKINRSKARLLTGYPGVLSEFAHYCGRQSIRLQHLRAIISGAEALYDHHRRSIEDNLHVPLFNRYGCREVGSIAHEIPGAQGLVVNSDRILLEVIDENGQPCAPGVIGRLLVTDLDNLGMPLIRYDIGDLGCWAAAEQSRYRLPYPVLERVEGRSLDIVTSSNGRRVGGTFWTHLLRERPGIAKFQVVQDRRDSVRIRYISDSGLEQGSKDYFTSRIRDVCGSNFAVNFSPVERIDPEPNGKYKIVVSQLEAASPRRGDGETPQ